MFPKLKDKIITAYAARRENKKSLEQAELDNKSFAKYITKGSQLTSAERKAVSDLWGVLVPVD